jgi:hypothetical protein
MKLKYWFDSHLHRRLLRLRLMEQHHRRHRLLRQQDIQRQGQEERQLSHEALRLR